MIADQVHSSVLVAGILWVRDIFLGTAATYVAIICVATVGYSFLAGRAPVGRAVDVLIGCFILFGAPNIAAALSALAIQEPSPATLDRKLTVPLSVMSPRTPSRRAPDPFDPYTSE